MAVPKRKNEYLGLKNLDVLVEDTVFDSQYFRVLECPVILTQGKSSFLIGGSSDLKTGVEIKIELCNNNTDETIYTEPIRGHLEGDLRRVSIEVYNDVTPGAYTLYVVGELDPATSGVSIPPEWQNIYNVRWSKQITVNGMGVNTQPIYFYKQPSINVTELFTGFVEVPSGSATTVYLTGSGEPRQGLTPIAPVENATGGGFGTSTYPDLDFANKAKLSIIEENKPLVKLSGKHGLIGSQGQQVQTMSPVPSDFVITVSGNSTINSLYVGHNITINNPQIDTSKFATESYHEIPSTYSSTVMKVLNKTTFVPKDVFYVYDNRTDPATLVPAPFTSTYPISASYLTLPTQNTSSINLLSFGDIEVSDLRTFSGDVHKLKIYAKSEGSLGDFEKIYDSPIESYQVLYDKTEDTLLSNMGYWLNSSRINNYWETSEGVDGTESGTLTYDATYINDAMKVSGSNKEYGDTLRVQNKTAVDFIAGNLYTFKAKVYGIKRDKKDIDSTVSAAASFKVFAKGDAFNKDTTDADHWGVEKLSVPGIPVGSDEYDFGIVEGSFLADNTGTGYIQFKVDSGEWYISDISVKASSDTAFNPDFVRVKAPVPPLLQRPDRIRFLVEFYDVNNNIADSVIFSEPFDFQGANINISGTDNILSGSMVIGSALGSGIEMAGVGSGFVRSIGYKGFTSGSSHPSLGPGFLMWSGSVLSDITDDYSTAGVGLELVGHSGSYLRFRTNPSELDIRADAFFVGNPNSQYISGSGSQIEISSSNFHVSSSGDVTMTGTITAEAGNIGDWQIIDGKLSGSNATLDAVGAALYHTALGPGTDTSATFDQLRNEYYIDFTPSEGPTATAGKYYVKFGPNFSVSESGVLFASGAVFEGQITASTGFIGGASIESTSLAYSPYWRISSSADTTDPASFISSSRFKVSAGGNITGSQVLFTGGKIAGATIADTKLSYGSNWAISASSVDDELFISSSKFKVRQSGDVTGSQVLFTGGKIAGFDISGTQLKQGTSFYLDGGSGATYFISSSDFQVTPSGDVSGSQVLFTGGKIAGFDISGTKLQQGTSFYLDGDSGGTYFISASNFQVTPGGSLTAVEGSIAGWTIDDISMTGGDMIIRKDGTIESSGFASNVPGSGFRLTAASGGFLEVENARIRGTLSTAVFEKESVNAVGGQLYIANSTTLTSSATHPSPEYATGDTTMSVVNVTGFVEGEVLSAKKVSDSGFATEYILVQSASRDNPSSDTDYSGQIYVTRGYGSGVSGESGSLGDTPSTAQKYSGSQVIVSTGKINTGYIRLNANPNDPTTPYMDIVERTGSGIYDIELKARLGDLSGLSSGLLYGETNPGFGLFTENIFLQGSITAKTGSFIGAVHVGTNGTMKFGQNVSSTNDGIFINTNNFWYDTGNFKVGDGTSFISSSGEIQTDKFELITDRVKISSTYASMSIGNAPTLTSGTGIFLSGSGEFRLGDDDGNIKFTNDSFSITGSDLSINVNQLNISASGFTLSSPQASMSLGNNDEILLHATGGTGGVPIFKLSGGEISSSNFFVSTGGNLTASNATFQGIISSSEANIGGWTVDEGAVYKGVARLSSSAEPGLYIEDNYGNPMVLIAEKSMFQLGSDPDEVKNESFEVTQSGEDTAGYHLGTSASPLTVHSWSFSSTGPISHSITKRSGSGFSDFNAAVLGDFTFDVIHPGQRAPITSLSRSFGDASASYLSGNTYEFTQIVSASQAAGNLWKEGNVVSFAGVAKMSHSFGGAGVDRGFQKQKYKVDYWTGTEWTTFIPKVGSRAMRSDGFAHYSMGQRYSSIAGAGALPTNSEKLRITLTGSINPDTTYIKTQYLYQGAVLDPMQSLPSNGPEVNNIVVLNTTESAKYAYTEITFDNFRLRQSQPRVELSPDGFLLYASDNSYLKMTPEGIDFRGGQGFSQVSTMLAGETNSDNIDVYGSLAAPNLQAYEADTAPVSTTGFQGNVNEFSMGNHRHALEFSTVNSVINGETFTNGTWNSGFGAIAGDSISGSWQSQGFTIGAEVSGSWQGYISGSGIVSHSQFSSPSQGTVRATLNGITTDVDTGLQSGDTPYFNNLNVTNDIFASGLYISSSASTNVIQVGADGTGGIQKWEWHRDGTRKWLIYNDGRTGEDQPLDSMVFKHGVVTDGDDHINFHMEQDDQSVYFHGDISQSSGTIYGDILEIQKGATFNTDQSPAYDFEVKSVNLNHMLYVDSNYDKVGIGFNSPGGKHLSSSLHIAGDLTVDSHITASGNISASGTIYVSNTEFPQLQLSDDGYTDSMFIGMSGNTGYIKSSDTSNGMRIRRSDNFDIMRWYMNTETTQISGSGGLSVIGNISASGHITASGNIKSFGDMYVSTASPRIFLETGAAHRNYKISAQDSTTHTFEIASGEVDGDASSETWTPQLKIDTNTAAFTNKVGVGTSVAPEQLTVAGNVSASSFISSDTPWADIRAYGAAPGESAANNVIYIQRAINSLPSDGGTVFFPRGTYELSDSLWVSSSNVTFHSDSAILECNHTGPGIMISQSSADSRPSGFYMEGKLRITRDRTSYPLGTQDGSKGIHLSNTTYSHLRGFDISYFNYGLYLEGSGSGVAYNVFEPVRMADNLVQLKFANSASNGTVGWVNQNTFNGGQWMYTSLYDNDPGAYVPPSSGSFVDMTINVDAQKQNNANNFMRMSMECSPYMGSERWAPAVKCYGTRNIFFDCRSENTNGWDFNHISSSFNTVMYGRFVSASTAGQDIFSTYPHDWGVSQKAHNNFIGVPKSSTASDYVDRWAIFEKTGIGTDDPEYPLHVSGSPATIKIEGGSGSPSWKARLLIDRKSGDRGGGIWIEDSDGDESKYWIGAPYNGGSNSGGISIGYHGTQPEYIANSLVFVDNTGKFGIGTTDPSVPLHIKGDADTTNAVWGWIQNASTGTDADAGLAFTGGGNTFNIGVDATTDSFVISDTGAAVLGSNQRLVIGTDGNISASGDFVPTSDAGGDLGSSTLEWKDLYIDGTAYLDSATITGGSITGITDLVVADGGTGVSSFTVKSVIVSDDSSTTADLVAKQMDGSGELLIGGSSGPEVGTITADDGLAVTVGDGTIELDLDLKANGGLVIESDKLALDLAASSITNTLAVGDGGTGATTFTDGGILLGNTAGAIQATAVLTNGQLLIGDNSTDPTLATLTGTTNQVVVANGAGSITLSTPQSIHTDADVTFDSLTLDDLTATRLVASDGSEKLVSSDLNSWVTGTSNQITVTDDGDGTITLSTPQDTHTGANPTFAGVNAGNINVGVTGDNEIDTDSGNLTIDSYGGTITLDDHVIVSGDFTVSGTQTIIDSTTLNIADNIIELNAGTSDGGLYVKETTGGNATGSLLWDVSENRWIGGTAGGEINLVTISSTDTLTNKTLTSPDINTPDIDGGTVDAITSLTVANDVDVGDWKITSKALEASDLTSGRVTFAGANGLLADDSDLTFSGETLTATKIGAFEAAGAIDFSDEAMTNVNIDSGIITGITDLAVADGGTGLSTVATDNILTGNGAGDLTAETALTFDGSTLTINNTVAGSTTYSSGFAGGGWRIDDGITTSGKTSATFDNLTIRGQMNVYEMLIHQVRATNGSIWVSNTGKIESSSFTGGAVGERTYTLFFPSGSGAGHGFRNADSIRAQRWSPTGDLYQSDLFVLSTDIDSNGTGSLTATLSGSIGTGAWSDEPLAGMDYVRIGNISSSVSSSRQGAIYLTSDDDNAPYIDVVDGVTHHGTFNTSGNIKTRMGKLTGITSPTMGTLEGYGFYASGSAWLEGKINATDGGYIAEWDINKTSITSPSSIIKLSSADKRISINDGAQDRIWLGEVDGSTTYGMKIFDGVGQTDDDLLVELGEGGNIIAGWEISGSRIHKHNLGVAGSDGGLILDATNLRYDVYTGSFDNSTDGTIVRMGQIASNKFGILGNDTSGNLLFKLGMDGNEIVGWDLTPGNIVSDNTDGSVRLSSTSQSLTIWTGSVNEAEPKVVLGKLPLHDGTVDSPYGFAVFSGSGTVSGSQASASVLITQNKARLAGWELSPGKLSSGTVASIDGNNASIALGLNATSAGDTPATNLFYVKAGAAPVFYVGEHFSYTDDVLTAAGWTVASGVIQSPATSPSAKLISTGAGAIALGPTPPTSYNSGDGFYASGRGTFLVGSGSGERISFDGSNLIMSASTFLLGTSGSAPHTGAYISGSLGNLEISSSNFFLKSDGTLNVGAGNFTVATNGDVAMTGNISATTGDIGGFNIGTYDIWGGNATIGNSATTIVMGNLDGTSKIALGATADNLSLTAGTGFYADGGGNFKVGAANSYGIVWDGSSLQVSSSEFYLGDATNYISGSGGAISIGADTFDLSTTYLRITDTEVASALAEGIVISGGSKHILVGSQISIEGDGDSDYGSITIGSKVILRGNSDSTISGWTIGTDTISATNAILGSDGYLSLGSGTSGYGNANRTYIDGENNRMSIGQNFLYTGDELTVAGWNITSNAITSSNVHISSSGQAFNMGDTPPTSWDSGAGIHLSGSGTMLVGDSTGNRIQFNGSTAIVRTNTWVLDATTIFMSSQDNSGTIRLGNLANTTTTATTNKGFMATGEGNMLLKADDSDTNYIKFNPSGGGSALEIKTADFEVVGGNVTMKGVVTANSGRIGGVNGWEIGTGYIRKENIITIDNGQSSWYYAGDDGYAGIAFGKIPTSFDNASSTGSYWLQYGTQNVFRVGNQYQFMKFDGTSGANPAFEISSSNFMLGAADTAYISASLGNLEISSSKFHVSSSGDVYAKDVFLTDGNFEGTVNANATIQGATVKTGGPNQNISAHNVVITGPDVMSQGAGTYLFTPASGTPYHDAGLGWGDFLVLGDSVLGNNNQTGRIVFYSGTGMVFKTTGGGNTISTGTETGLTIGVNPFSVAMESDGSSYGTDSHRIVGKYGALNAWYMRTNNTGKSLWHIGSSLNDGQYPGQILAHNLYDASGIGLITAIEARQEIEISHTAGSLGIESNLNIDMYSGAETATRLTGTYRGYRASIDQSADQQTLYLNRWIGYDTYTGGMSTVIFNPKEMIGVRGNIELDADYLGDTSQGGSVAEHYSGSLIGVQGRVHIIDEFQSNQSTQDQHHIKITAFSGSIETEGLESGQAPNSLTTYGLRLSAINNGSATGVTNYGVHTEGEDYNYFSGRVSIGDDYTPDYPLEVRGQVSNTSIYAQYDVAAYSDIRVKTDIETITEPLSKVLKMRGVTFRRTDEGSTDKRLMGVIAQEIEDIVPEVVSTNEIEDSDRFGHKSVSYGNMTALLIEAIKEQQEQIDELKQEVKEIKDARSR